MQEKTRIDEVYTRYEGDAQWRARYSVFRPEVLLERQNLERAQLRALARAGLSERIGTARVLDIGGGTGSFVLSLLRWGASPQNITLNELFEPRLERAREMLPVGVKFAGGDAAALDHTHDGQYDIVAANTVLSSILDEQARTRLLQRMFELLAPGGVVLIYDFTFNNPNNKSVCRVPKAFFRSVLPDAPMHFQRLTLAPPLSRRLARIPLCGEALLHVCNLPPLRTHLLTLIQKKA